MTDILPFMLRFMFITIIYLFIFSIIRMIYLDIRYMHFADNVNAPESGSYLYLLNDRNALEYGTSEYYPLKKDVIIGRNKLCSITFDDPLLSGRHLRIWFRNEEWRIEDLKSKNGTYLNQELMDTVYFLDDGDIIKIGHLELQFCLND